MDSDTEAEIRTLWMNCCIFFFLFCSLVCFLEGSNPDGKQQYKAKETEGKGQLQKLVSRQKKSHKYC